MKILLSGILLFLAKISLGLIPDSIFLFPAIFFPSVVGAVCLLSSAGLDLLFSDYQVGDEILEQDGVLGGLGRSKNA